MRPARGPIAVREFAAREADAAQLAAKGGQQFARAAVAAQAHEAVREDAAFEIRVELVFDELG